MLIEASAKDSIGVHESFEQAVRAHKKLTATPRQSWQSLAHLRVLENAPAEPPPEPCNLDAPLGLHTSRFVPSLPVGTPTLRAYFMSSSSRM